MDDVLLHNIIGTMDASGGVLPLDELDAVVAKVRASLAQERAALEDAKRAFQTEMSETQGAFKAQMDGCKALHAAEIAELRDELAKERAALADARRAFEAKKAEMVKVDARASDVIDLNVGGQAMSKPWTLFCVPKGVCVRLGL